MRSRSHHLPARTELGPDPEPIGARFDAIMTALEPPAATSGGGGRLPCTRVAHVDDDAIRSLVTRLGRAHRSGGTVIERAAIVADGGDSEAVMTWIAAHGGTPEAAVETSPRHGLHGSRMHGGGASESRPPSRFILPPGGLD
jgi:hypothetical protein